MNNLLSVLIVLSLLIISGCNSAPQGNTEYLSNTDEFMTAFNNKDVAAIDKFIDKEYGFFVIYNPGAFTVAMHLNSFGDIMSMEGEYDVANLKVTKVNCSNYREGLEPVYSCDDDGWNKTGCFYGTQKNLSVAGTYDTMLEYDLIDAFIAPRLRDLAAKSEANYAYFVYSTDETIGFYFGEKNGKYYLIAIDRVIPCSA